MKRLVLATSNAGKLAEIRRVLETQPFEIVPQSAFDVPDVAETGLSFVENALIKARHASRHASLPAMADDSGLEVASLGGAPGIRSARYAGEDASDAENVAKLLSELHQGERSRDARFVCVIALVRHADDPAPVLCEGHWHGVIAESPKGENGFGYDPVFFVRELGRTAAELAAEEKNRISHRGRALAQLAAQLDATTF
ncbi:MAG: RdgB/HAM1 family non-canonical purine NTP pyrophosphatase [Gammaproteobacteria bacterium]